MIFIKASERMPTKEGRYAVKRYGEIMACDCKQRANGEFVFTIPNGMTWKGYKEFEWLDESLTPSPTLKQLSDCWDAATERHRQELSQEEKGISVPDKENYLASIPAVSIGGGEGT